MDGFWMIEKKIDGNPHWWMRRPNQYGEWNAPDRWTMDPNLAKHYDSKREAEFVMGREMADGGCIATDHAYMESPSKIVISHRDKRE